MLCFISQRHGEKIRTVVQGGRYTWLESENVNVNSHLLDSKATSLAFGQAPSCCNSTYECPWASFEGASGLPLAVVPDSSQALYDTVRLSVINADCNHEKLIDLL